MTRNKKQTKTYNGFAIPLEPDTELGLAMLIAEDVDGRHEPIGVAATINEAKEMADCDLRDRLRRIERGEDALCPSCYKLWARGIDGDYRLAQKIKAL